MIDIQRRQPTGSEKKRAAPMVTTSGNACRIAEMLPIGRLASAARKNIVAASSNVERNTTIG